MRSQLTEAEVRRRFVRELQLLGSQRRAAQIWGVSQALISYIVAGERSIGPKILRALKLRPAQPRYQQAGRA